MTLSLSKLQECAEKAREIDCRVIEDFIAAMNPQTAMALIRVAMAAQGVVKGYISRLELAEALKEIEE